MQTEEKIKLNSLIDEKKNKLTTEEKGSLVMHLRKNNYSYAQLQKITGIPKATLHGWVNGRASNCGSSELTLHKMYLILKDLKEAQDIVTLNKIKQEIGRLLNPL